MSNKWVGIDKESPPGKWIPLIQGDPNSKEWEISVVRENDFGRKSWGWFSEHKLLVSHNGGPCRWPLAPGLGPIMVKLAEKLAAHLNELEIIADMDGEGGE